MRLRDGERIEYELHLAADQVSEGRCAAAIGDMPRGNARLEAQKLPRQVRQAAVPARSEQDLCRARLRELDQLLERIKKWSQRTQEDGTWRARQNKTTNTYVIDIAI